MVIIAASTAALLEKQRPDCRTCDCIMGSRLAEPWCEPNEKGKCVDGSHYERPAEIRLYEKKIPFVLFGED